MNSIRKILLIVPTFLCLHAGAKAPVPLSGRELEKPHRIIRTCCSFGVDMKFFAVPGIKLTEITGLDKIGEHHYLGDPGEQNGIIYTSRGGFIDMGHVRDQADWTAFLYTWMLENKAAVDFSMMLGHEGGEKTLSVTIPENFSKSDIVHLAGKIAYDLSVWHEIATWFGASSIPFIPERYSSFSIEDAYSNLLGVTIGIKAIQSDLPYEEAVTQIISQTLSDLKVVHNELETVLAMEDVRGVWWTREKRLPSGKVLLQRQLNVYPCLKPWLVPGWSKTAQDPHELVVPEATSKGELLDNFYELEFKLNYKFPFRKIFPDRKDRSITQRDFKSMLNQIASELTKKDSRFQ